MVRLHLGDARWHCLRNLLLGHGIYDKGNLRIRLEAMFWRLRTGAPWRDLPEVFGPWSSCYNQFNRWSSKGIIQSLVEAYADQSDDEWNLMDSGLINMLQAAQKIRTPPWVDPKAD